MCSCMYVLFFLNFFLLYSIFFLFFFPKIFDVHCNNDRDRNEPRSTLIFRNPVLFLISCFYTYFKINLIYRGQSFVRRDRAYQSLREISSSFIYSLFFFNISIKYVLFCFLFFLCIFKLWVKNQKQTNKRMTGKKKRKGGGRERKRGAYN